MKIVLSDHARYQMRVRNLQVKDIRRAMKKPDGSILQPDGRIQVVKEETRSGKQYLIVVVFEVEKDVSTVVTAFRTSKIKKYL